MPRPIDLVVIHCSASPNGDSLFRGRLGESNYRTPTETIDAWHKDRGFRRDYNWRVRWNPALDAIGYHYVIQTNGAVATGRSPGEIGAHAQGHNATSLGICLVGTDRFSAAQWASLKALVELLLKQHPGIGVVGHRELPNVHKLCPGFDVDAWRRAGFRELTEHLLP